MHLGWHGVISVLLCSAFIPRLCRLGILTLETLTVYDAGSQSKLLLVEGQFLVGAGNAYMQQSVRKQAAYFGCMISQLKFYYAKSC